MRSKQRGIAGGWLYLIGVGVLAAVIWGIHHAGYVSGEADKQAEWNAANARAQKQADTLRVAQQALLREESRQRQAAEASALDYQTKWKEAKNEAKRSKRPLALTDCGSSKPAADATDVALDRGDRADPVRLSLTWEFVSLHDSAWTGASGQPLFGDRAGILAQAGGPDPSERSPYGLDELLDVHQGNAVRFDACRRDFNRLIDVVERLRAQWDVAMGAAR